MSMVPAEHTLREVRRKTHGMYGLKTCMGTRCNVRYAWRLAFAILAFSIVAVVARIVASHAVQHFVVTSATNESGRGAHNDAM